MFAPLLALLVLGKVAGAAGEAQDNAPHPVMVVQTGHAFDVETIADSPDFRHFVTGGGHTVILWDARLGAEILSWPAQTDRINSVAFSPDGRCVFSGGQEYGKQGPTVREWGNTTTLKPIRTLSFAGEVDASLGAGS